MQVKSKLTQLVCSLRSVIVCLLGANAVIRIQYLSAFLTNTDRTLHFPALTESRGTAKGEQSQFTFKYRGQAETVVNLQAADDVVRT